MRMGRVPGVLLALAGAAWVGGAALAESLPPDCTVITSKKLTYDLKRSVAIFEGDVVVQDRDMRMESDRLNVVMDSTNNVRSVTATGNVRIQQQDKTATCRKAIYLAQSGELLLQGDAQLRRGQDLVRGDEISYWVEENRVECSGGEGATMVIYPQENKGPSPRGRVIPKL